MKKKLSNRVIVRTGNLMVAGALLAILSSTTSLAQETSKQTPKDTTVSTETTAAAAADKAATETPVAKEKTATKGNRAAKAGDAAKELGWDDYKVILERNMFSKNRQPPFDPTAVRPRDDRPPANPESFYILRGITNENGMFKACLQDNKQGGVLWVIVGDTVARGKIKAIPSLDTIEFQMDGQETARTVPMGCDLEGGRGKIDVRDVPNMMGGGSRPDRGADMRFGGGNMRMNDMRSRSQPGFNTGFNRRDRVGMGGMGMGMPPQASPPSSSSSSDTTLSGSDAEILRKMMERRAAEMGQAVPASDPNQQQPGQ